MNKMYLLVKLCQTVFKFSLQVIVLFAVLAVAYGAPKAEPKAEPKAKPGLLAAAYTTQVVAAPVAAAYSAPYVAPAYYSAAYAAPYAYPYAAYSAYSAPLVIAWGRKSSDIGQQIEYQINHVLYFIYLNIWSYTE